MKTVINVIAIGAFAVVVGGGSGGTVATERQLMMDMQCEAGPRAPSLDHVVVAVEHLDAAAARFQQLGFRLKPGRLHPNGLLNRHIKFRDGSEIELMTVSGVPQDQMAADYKRFIDAGEGGIYLALSGVAIDTAELAARQAGFESRRSSSGTWQFLSFPAQTPAAAIFFGSGVPGVHDPDSVVSHASPVTGLAEVWLDGGAEVRRMMEALGAVRCGIAVARSGQTGERWALRNGSVVFLNPLKGARPRVHGAVLKARGVRGVLERPHSRFWLYY